MTYINQTLNESLYRRRNDYLLNISIFTGVILSLLTVIGCNDKNGESVKILHEGSYIIKAKLVNGKSNGKTEFYDSSGKLTGFINYKDDEKWGMCVHYFPNGIVSDSVEYVCDKEQGYWRHYDQRGVRSHFSYFYFGLQFGPDLWFDKDTILRNYNFLNFERQPIVECTYNRYGHLDSIVKMDLTLFVEEREKNGTPLFKLFAYLPCIPLADEMYSIGIIDSNKIARKLCDIENRNFFIDTLLAAPPRGFHFYLGCDLKANGEKFDETIMVEAVKKVINR